MTDDARVQYELEWALQHQHRVVARALEARRTPRRVLRQRLIGCGVAGALVLAVMAVALPHERTRSPVTFVVLGLFFVWLFVMGLSMPRVDAAARRWAGRRISRRAVTLLREVPSTIPASAGLVITTPRLAVVFARPLALRPIAILERPRADEVEQLRRRGAARVRLDGPIEGFAAPIPEARVR